MAKKQGPRIGEIQLTAKQKEIVAEGVESEFFKIIKNIIRPQRQTQIAVTAINAAFDKPEFYMYKGQSKEWDRLVKVLQDEADKFNKEQEEEESEDK